MSLTKIELEQKVDHTNRWLAKYPFLEGTPVYRAVLHKRNYYVNELIKLEEHGKTE